MAITPITLKRLFNFFQPPALHSLLNLWAVEDDAIIGLDLQFSNVYKLTLPDITILADDEAEGFYSQLKILFNTLPDNIVLQFIFQGRAGNEGLIEQYSQLTNPKTDIAKLIISTRSEQLRKEHIINASCYLVVSTFPAGVRLTETEYQGIKAFSNEYKKIDADTHKKRIEQLNAVCTSVVNSLNSLSFRVTKLEKPALLDYLYKYLNPGRADVLDRGAIKNDMTLRSQICNNACEIDFDHIYLDGYYYRSVNLLRRPETAHFSNIINFLKHITPYYDAVFTIRTYNQESLASDLQKAGNWAANLAHFSLKPYHEARQKAEHSFQLVEEVKNTYQKLFGFSLSVNLRDTSLEGLTSKTNTVLKAFRELPEAEGIIDDINHLSLYLSGIPGHSQYNCRRELFHTPALVQLLPVSAPWEGCSRPYILFNTNDGRLLPYDLFSETLTSHHGVVIAKTGSGKSFLCNFLCENFYIAAENNHIIIIDKGSNAGSSYRKFATLFPSAYYELDIDEKYAMNAFPKKAAAIQCSDPSNFSLHADTLTFLTRFVQVLLKKQELTGVEQKVIETAIINTYKFTTMDPPILSALLHQLMNFQGGEDEDRKIARDMGRSMEIWATGRYGKLLNQPTSIAADSRVVVFDLFKLSQNPELQAVIFFLIQNVIDTKVRDISLRKLFIIDEGWAILNSEVGRLMTEDLYRTLRKSNGAVYFITQNPADLLNSKVASAIIGGSDVKYVLYTPSGVELYKQYDIKDKELELIRSLQSVKRQYSDIFIKYGNNSRVARVKPSAIDYWVCTTDATDWQKEFDLRKEHPDWSNADIIKALAGL